MASSAQATRAILLASAIATILNGRRARSCVSHGLFSGFFLASHSTECAPTSAGQIVSSGGQPPRISPPRPPLVLVALDVSLHVFGRHQTNLVTELRQLTCPVVRGGTGLHANQAGRHSFEELHQLAEA